MLLIVILVLAVPGSSQQPYPCSTKYTVRLDRNSYGRLQICWSEEGSSALQWYSVCNVLYDVAAAVVCRQLGFNSAGYQDHEAVRFFSNCANGVQLQCARSDTHIQNCTVKTVRASSQAGVICDASPREIQSCVPASPSIPPRTISPPASQNIIPTTITEQMSTDSARLLSITASLQSSSIAQTKYVVGGVLGVAIGILAIVVVGLLIGWIHHHRNSKRYKTTINPSYDTAAHLITTSRSNQQTTPTGRSGTNPSRGAGPLNHVLEGPLPVESVEHTEGQYYEVVSEDIVGISSEVPITTRNKTEQFEEEHQENDQDYSMVNDFTTERKSYKVPVQAVKAGQSQEEQKEKVNGRQT